MLRCLAHAAFPRAAALATPTAQLRFQSIDDKDGLSDAALDAALARSGAKMGKRLGAKTRKVVAKAMRTSFLRGSDAEASALGLLRPAVRQATVFNPFIGRVVKVSSPQVQALAAIGISPVAGSMRVSDPSVLNEFAADVRARRASLPTSWPARVRDKIGSVLADTRIADPAAAVTKLLRDMELSREVSRASIGIIGSTSEEELQAELEAASNLNSGQKNVLAIAEQGYSMYIGGHAGTGKTVLLRAIRGRLKQRGVSVGTTATTGLAAAHLGGVTFHSFMGINRHAEVVGSKALSNVDALIVDEISMLDRAMFEEFDRALRRIRARPDALFGGVQVIVCGDFLQLEPVSGTERTADGRSKPPRPIFESPIFRERLVHVALNQQMRQAGDERFAKGLHSLRRGVWPASFSHTVRMITQDLDISLIRSNDETAAAFGARGGTPPPPAVPAEESGGDGAEATSKVQMMRVLSGATESPDAAVTPTTDSPATAEVAVPERPVLLLARNRDVRIANEARMAELPSDPVEFLPCPQAPSLGGSWTTNALLGSSVPAARPKGSTDGTTHDPLMGPDAVKAAVLLVHAHLSKLVPNNPRTVRALTPSHVVLYPFLDGMVLRVRVPGQYDEGSRAVLRALFEKLCTEELSGVLGGVTLARPGSLVLIDLRDAADGLQSPEVDEALSRTLDAHPVAKPLTLKVGCEVMLRSNLSNKHINGSVGTVTGFVPATDDNVAPAFKHVRNIFATLEAYVAQQRFQHGVEVPLMPVVHFRGEPAPVPVPPVAFAAGGDALTHYFELSALCVPLVQAYAFTIHKVQGMTLMGDVHIALGKLWRCNHIVYVALSRVRRPEQVLLSGFRASLVAVNQDAVGFDVCVPDSSDADAVARGLQGCPPADWVIGDDADHRFIPVPEAEPPAIAFPSPPSQRQQQQEAAAAAAAAAASWDDYNCGGEEY